MTERLAEIGLASASPRRLALLESLGLRVVVLRSAYDEDNDRGGETAIDRALRHAVGKVEAAEGTLPHLVVGADTIVDVDGVMLGKPRDAAEATAMLRMLSGRRHVVHTGFALRETAKKNTVSGVESSSVRFVALDDGMIERYVATREPMDKAGAYGIQGLGALLVERIEGDFYTVMGLPLARVAAACRALGFEIL